MDATPVKPTGITHDAAARLLGLAPADLERLVAAGHVRRNDRNSYSVPVLVSDYITHLQQADQMHPTQAEMAAHVDTTDRTIRELEPKLKLAGDYTREQFRLAYIRHLREVAAGRGSQDPEALDLANERAKLAREQRESIAIKNAVARKEYAAVSLLGEVLATASQAVSERFEQLPGMLKRACPDLPEAARDQVMATIAAARNEWVKRTAQLAADRLAEEEGDDVDVVDV